MKAFKAFLKRKNIDISWKSYGIKAMGAMAQGLFASLLIGTIIKTLGEQVGNAIASIDWQHEFLMQYIHPIFDMFVDVGTLAQAEIGRAHV